MFDVRHALIWLAVLTLGLSLGCARSNLPVSPDPTQQVHQTETGVENNSSRILWGFYDIAIDGTSGNVDILPVRQAEFNANITRFLQPPLSVTNLVLVSLNSGSDIHTGHLDMNITIQHPFPGNKKLRGFDVRGIVMGNGNEHFDMDDSATRSAAGDLQLLNPDGWTRWWNPTEFTTFGKLFGYTKGSKSTPGYVASAIVNPYKYFADGLGKDALLSAVVPASRGSFSTSPGVNTRRYILQFPTPSGKPVYHFNYAIDASWAAPDPGSGPSYPLSSFPPEANMAEAWQINVDTTGTDAWYVDNANKGGKISLSVEAFDWQGGQHSNGVADEISAIWVESPVLSAPINILPLTAPQLSNSDSAIWKYDLSFLKLTSSGDFDLWIAVEANHPDNYAPQIPGNPDAFDWPDKPIRAYMRSTVHVLDTFPNQSPDILLVAPAFGEVDKVVKNVEIHGTGFQDGATVEFRKDVSTTLTVSNVTWIDSTTVKCNVDCAAPLGSYDVKLTNPDTQNDTLANAFEIIVPSACTGSAHDWGSEYALSGAGTPQLRGGTAIMYTGANAGKALIQTSNYAYGLFDPLGPADQSVQWFLSLPGNCFTIDVKTCMANGRIGITSMQYSDTIWLYNDAGKHIGDLQDPLFSGSGTWACFDFDRDGDLWAVTRTGNPEDPATWDFQLRHYQTLDEAPFYQPVPADTVNIDELGIMDPNDGGGVGDMCISFTLNRLFIFASNSWNLGTNKISSWDLNASPPHKMKEVFNPFPGMVRVDSLTNGAHNRMTIDIDHRYEDQYEKCRMSAYATIWVTDVGLHGYAIRLDADLNILDTGTIFEIPQPIDFDIIPQCAIFVDGGPGADASLVGCDTASPRFYKWPTPSDW